MTQTVLQQTSRLIHTGQVIVDLVMQIDALPAPGGDVLARDASFEVGGGFNVMAAARRNGMHVVYPGGLGNGRFGALAREALVHEGVEIAGQEVADRDTGICVAIVDASAERTFVSHMGAESVLERDVLNGLAVNARDIVYVSGYSLMLADKGAVLIDWLEQMPRGTRVAFDPGPLVGAIDPALLKRMLGVVSIWSSNREEALRFAQTDNFDTAFNTIIARLAPGALAIVRDGARGCELRVGDTLTCVPGFEVKAVDSNGAGDAHAGVFLAVLATGQDAKTAAQRANAAAAIAVTRYGPATSPDTAEIDAFMASRGQNAPPGSAQSGERVYAGLPSTCTETRMTASTAQQIVLAARPTGSRAQLTDFRLEEVPVPVPKAGQVLLRIDYLSLDPYMRGRMNDARSYAKPAQVGEPMPGESVATVIESKDAALPVGAQVLVTAGWVSHAVADAKNLNPLPADGIPARAYLGVLGMPGFTAYSGMAAIGKPKSGETVVVGAASGPVGSLVGQLAKLAGARVVGIAGGEKKCAYVVEQLGFDAAIDHRSADFADQLANACPKGIDVYFENIGGAVWKAVLPLLNQYGRVPVCGLMAQTSGKNDGVDDGLATTMRAILTRSLTVRGYINYEFLAEYREAFLNDIGGYLREDKIKHQEDVTDGLANAPQAFLDMIDGRNFGKVLVRVGGSDF